MNIVLLLTACVNPNSSHMLKLRNVDDRKKQYINAIEWYFKYTPYYIVFAENSGTPLSLSDEIIKSPRFEYLKWKEEPDVPDRGKGYKEAKIHEKVIADSQLYKGADIVVKITGRLIMTNIVKTILSIGNPSKRLLMSNFGWKFKYQDTRFIIAGKYAFEELQKANSRINTIVGMEEAYAAESVKLIRDGKVDYELSKYLPNVIGVGGGTAENYSKRGFKWIKNLIKYRIYYMRHKKIIVQEIMNAQIP